MCVTHHPLNHMSLDLYGIFDNNFIQISLFYVHDSLKFGFQHFCLFMFLFYQLSCYINRQNVSQTRENSAAILKLSMYCASRGVCVISHEHILQYSHTFTAGTCTIWKPLKLVAFTFVLQGKKVVFY